MKHPEYLIRTYPEYAELHYEEKALKRRLRVVGEEIETLSLKIANDMNQRSFLEELFGETPKKKKAA